MVQQCELPVDFRRGLLSVHVVGRQPQADVHCAGQVGQVQVGGQRVFPVGDRFGEDRFGQSVGDRRFVYDRVESEMFVQPRQHLLADQRFHFERDARQRYEHFAVPLEPHARSRSATVRQDGASVRHEGLALIQFVEVDVPYGSHRAHLLVDGLVAYQFHAEQPGQRMFGDVVLGRAETAGADDDVGVRQRLRDGFGDRFGSVGYRSDPVDFDSGRVQLFADPCRVGVDDLSDQNFVADGNDFCLHRFSDPESGIFYDYTV